MKGGPESFKVKYYSCTNSIFDNSLLGTGDTVGNKTVFMEIIIRKGRKQTNIICKKCRVVVSFLTLL